MQETEIELLLAELGDALVQLGVQQPIRVLLVGGAFMLTQLHSRATTNDIDVLLKDIDDPASPLYHVLQSAVRTVAYQHQLSASWFNDVVGDALRSNGPIPAGTIWRSYGMLEVEIPPTEYILALKLLAGRSKDRSDITALCQSLNIVSRAAAQQIVDRYIPNKQLQQLNSLEATLDLFFP